MNKGIYVHFPFCDAKCLYCDFFSVPDMRKKELYEEALATALLSYKDLGITADTVFFGGGTPSLMSEAGAEKIFSALHTAFKITKDAEITLEANPSSLSSFPEKLSLFKSLGVNRLSLGAQSMNEKELTALGRRHSPLDVENTVNSARRVGFDNISLDLMVRIPHQTPETLLDTLENAVSLSPDHLSLYTLSIEDRTVFGARHKRGDSLSLASEECEEEMWESACSFLAKNGFEHYEVSNFAHDGKHSRHNLKYWRAQEYIGVGASAHSYFESVRYSHPAGLDSFIENPTKRENEEAIDDTTRALEYVMLSLRLSDGILFDTLEKKHGIFLPKAFFVLAKRLEASGLAMLSDTGLTLTEKGWRVSNSIIENVLETLDLM